MTRQVTITVDVQDVLHLSRQPIHNTFSVTLENSRLDRLASMLFDVLNQAQLGDTELLLMLGSYFAVKQLDPDRPIPVRVPSVPTSEAMGKLNESLDDFRKAVVAGRDAYQAVVDEGVS